MSKMNVIRYTPATKRVVLPAPEMSHVEGQNSFTLSNVHDVKSLEISSDKNMLDYSLLRDTEQEKQFRVDYEPGQAEHIVNVKYEGEHLKGSPFQLIPDLQQADVAQQEEFLVRQQQEVPVVEKPAPKKVSVDLDAKNNLLTVSNVENFNDLDIDTEMGYNIYHGDNPNQYKVFYTPQGVHDVGVKYGGEDVDSFRLVPENMRKEYELSQQQQQLQQLQLTDAPNPSEPAPKQPTQPTYAAVGSARPMPTAVPMEQPTAVAQQQPVMSNRGRLLMQQNAVTAATEPQLGRMVRRQAAGGMPVRAYGQ